MHCNGFKHENFWSNRNTEFLAFTFLEVRFLVDSSNCGNNRRLTNATVMVLYFFY